MVVLWNINQRSSAKSADAASSVWPSTVMRTTFVLWADREDWAHAKCQERERVTETKTVHHQRASFPALCWRDAWSCQESLQIRVRSESRADRLGPWALRTEEDSQSKEQVRTDRLSRSRVNWKRGSSWTYFQASKRPFLFCIDFQMPFLLSCYPSSKQ